MAKQIYNYELFTNKKEELKKIGERRSRSRRIKLFLGLGLVVFALVILMIINSSTSNYYTFTREDTTGDSGDVKYKEYGKGYIKYSRNGIEYQKKFGLAEWNYPLSCNTPFLEIAGTYALLGEKGDNHLYLFDEKGLVREFNTNYPVLQAGVSGEGFVEVIMEGVKGDYIQVYDLEGKLIADIRATLGETGYPLTAAISDDGTMLVVGYYSISGAHSQTNIVFYNLGRQIKNNDDDQMVVQGGFAYENLLVPKLTFVRKDTLAAFGDGKTILFKVNNNPRESRVIEFAQPIESVFTGHGIIGYILDNDEKPEEGKYVLELYDYNGARRLSRTIDMNYDSIRLWKKQIIAIRENECTIMNSRGVILYQGKLEGDSIDEIIPMPGFRTYRVIFRDKTVEMKLQFWNTGRKE